MPLVGEAEARGGGGGAGVERGILGLRQVDQLLVVAEVERQQVGMAVKAEPLDDQPLEVAHQVVGQVEGADLRLGQRVEGLGAGEEAVAVRAVDALDAFLGQHLVEQRSEERRVGKECVSTCSSRWSPYS